MRSAVFSSACLVGTVCAPMSKSLVHRRMLADGLARAPVFSPGKDACADLLATEQGVIALTRLRFFDRSQINIRCGESATTLRLLLPVAAALGLPAQFSGQGKLPARPLSALLEVLQRHDVTFDRTFLPIRISGKLTPGVFSLPGNISSQFISGLLFALPLLEGDSKIGLQTPLESAPYVEMTRSVLHAYGIHTERTKTGYFIPGNQTYTPSTTTAAAVEGDYSQSAYFAVGGAISGDVRILGLRRPSVQGDAVLPTLLTRFGADAAFEADGSLHVRKSAHLCGCTIDVRDIPDLVPPLAVLAAYAEGTTLFTGAARLRYKECDRLDALYQMLCAIGVPCEQSADTLTVHGVTRPQGGKVCTMGDHRIAMAAAIAALGAKDGVVIDNPFCVAKSYPAFFTDYQSLMQ